MSKLNDFAPHHLAFPQAGMDGDRQLIPIEVQMAMREGCSDVRDEAQVVVGFMETCELDVDDAVLSRTASTLRADAQLRADLQYQYTDVFSARANLSGDVVYLERVLAVLREEQR